MNIVGVKIDHDSSIALLTDEHLVLVIEAEKNSNRRHARWDEAELLGAIARLPYVPDVLAVGGWYGFHAGYRGLNISLSKPGISGEGEPRYFSSSHERSHVICAYGLSPFEQGQPCYALVWEGEIGAFYEIDEKVAIRRVSDVLPRPGQRYALLFELADPTFPDASSGLSYDVAGKLMALAAYSTRNAPDFEERQVIATLLDDRAGRPVTKADLKSSRFYNIGVESEPFRELAGKLSDRLFERFFEVAGRRLSRDRPLLIAGGCGLNVEWNSRWRDSGSFPQVFVPPCTDDSGAAVGSAIDAQLALTGNAKATWSVFAGEEFVMDSEPVGLPAEPLDLRRAAELLLRGAVLAWVQGRCEIGPRALGNRSLLAAPFSRKTRDRLNRIKKRERYRPVAPVCRLEDVSRWFANCAASPHMLYLTTVLDSALEAVTHVDGSARLQTVTMEENPRLYELLTIFEELTGIGVLCNTSLNFHGRGFINRMSDLLRFVRERGVEGAVVGDRLLLVQPEINVSKGEAVTRGRLQLSGR